MVIIVIVLMNIVSIFDNNNEECDLLFSLIGAHINTEVNIQIRKHFSDINNTGARPGVYSVNVFTYGSGVKFIHNLVCRTKAVLAIHSHVSCVGRAFGNYRLVVQPRNV